MKTEIIRLALFCGKSRDVVRLGRFTRNPGGGGWRLDNQLTVFAMAEFVKNTRERIEECVRGEGQQREKTVINKAFLSEHDEITVLLHPSGNMQLIPLRREADGIGAIQATELPIEVAKNVGSQELSQYLRYALSLVRASR